MATVIDNTITSPTLISGPVYTGDSYLVPPVGAGGAWSGHEDEIATWNGSTWTFPAYPGPAAGSLYQVMTGPNAGRIYERTTVISPRFNLVVNPDLFYEIPDVAFPNWTILEFTGATAVWSYGKLVLTVPGVATAEAHGKTTFAVTAGVKYRAVVNVDAITVLGTGQSEVQYTLRNETGAVDMTTVEITAPGDTEFFFTAASGATSYSLTVRVISLDGSVGDAELRSIDVFRQAELVADGVFYDNFTEWTNPDNVDAPPVPLWVIDTGYAAPFAGNVALCAISFLGHPTFPALEQTVSSLQIGTYYRVAWDSEFSPDDGILSVAFDGTVLADATSGIGSFDYYFKATATSHTIQFPITKSGNTAFECKLDNVSMMAALWVAGPVVRSPFTAEAFLSCDVATTNAIRPGFTIDGDLTVGTALTKSIPGGIDFDAHATLECNPFVSYMHDVHSSMTVDVTATVGGVGNNVDISSSMSVDTSMRCRVADQGYFTVAQAVDAITELLSASSCSCATDGCGPLQKEALGCLNAAMQRLSASGREWGFVSNVALTLGPGVNQTGEIDLPADVVSVRRCMFRPALDDLGATFGTFELRPLMTRHEVEAYRRSSGRDLWPLTSAESAIAPYNIPIGYFTEGEDLRNGQPNGPPQLRILLAPVFNAARTWKVDLQAHVQPPRLTCENLTDGTRLPVPHRFAETLLVPLAKYYAMSLRWFRRPDLAESIQNQARDALMLTGEFQPANPQAGKEPKGAPAK